MAISKVKLPDNTVQDIKDARMGNARIFYGTCDTAAATVAKTVTCNDFTSEELINGALIFVTFTNTNSGATADLTLNVNNTGAKGLKKQYNDSTANLAAVGEIRGGSTYLFQFNATLNSGDGYWVCMTMDHNSSHSSMSTAEIDAGTGTTARVITPARLKYAVETLAPAVPTISINVQADKVSDEKTSSPKSVYDEVHPAIVTSQPSGGFVPNIMYNLGTLTGSKTFTLASPSDSQVVNHYYWTFTAGSTAPTITWPSGISWFGGSAPTITAGKHYDVSILDNIGVCMEV